MGWCYEFGPQIGEGCDHAMTAGEHSCMCTSCGVVCTGKFAGCSAVWAERAGDTIERPRRPRDSRLLRESPLTLVAEPDAAVGDPSFVHVEVAGRPLEAGLDQDDAAVAVVEWLREAFREMHGELRALGSRVQEHQRALTSRTGEQAEVNMAGVADDIVSRLEAILTARAVSPPDARPALDSLVADVRTAVAEARRDAAPVSVDITPTADELRQTVAEVHALTDQLRMEMARLAAFRRALGETNPAIAALVDQSADRASARYADRYGT